MDLSFLSQHSKDLFWKNGSRKCFLGSVPSLLGCGRWIQMCREVCRKKKNYLFLCSTPGESQWRLKNRQRKREKINLAGHVLSEGPQGGSVAGWDRRRNHTAMEILGKRRLGMQPGIPLVVFCSPVRSSAPCPHLAAAMHANIIPGALPPRSPICATPGEWESDDITRFNATIT